MSPVAKQITDMVYILPENDQNLVYELVKRMVLAWDPISEEIRIKVVVHIKRPLTSD